MKTKAILNKDAGRERLAIVDPHPATRNGISRCILDGGRWDLAWESGDGEEALRKVEEESPDGMVLEILLPGKDGLELIKHLLAISPALKILVHSVHAEEFYAERCLHAGALGYLPKTGSLDQLGKAIEQILHRDIYLNPHIAKRAISAIRHHRVGNDDHHHIHHLTDRELEIMILMAQGLTASESAEKLRISSRTVQVHRNNIRLKIGLENALQLHAYAVRFYGIDSEYGSGNGTTLS